MWYVASVFLFLLFSQLIILNHAAKNWDMKFPDLSHLGEQIKQKVNKGLRPVYEMQVRLKMETGRGGVTVITFRPAGKTYILKHGKQFECTGEISHQGTCSGDLKPFEIKTESDKCFKRFSNVAVVNDQLCMTDDSVSVVTSHSKGLVCLNGSGDKVETMNLRKFEEMCNSSGAIMADYKYVSKKKISPYKPKDARCSGSHPTVCTFSSKVNLSGGTKHIIQISN